MDEKADGIEVIRTKTPRLKVDNSVNVKINQRKY